MKESVLPCVSQGLNLGVQACQQAPVSTEPSSSFTQEDDFSLKTIARAGKMAVRTCCPC